MPGIISSRRGTLHDADQKPARLASTLIISYCFDWVVIVSFAAGGSLLSLIEPHHRPFSLLNNDISYPYVQEQITTWMLGVIAFLLPAALIAIITLFFIPGGNVKRMATRAEIRRLKLWELEKGLAGLCLSVAVAFFITQGMKNMFGKPRPNLLARCQPDLQNITAHVVGGYGQDISSKWALVSSSICTAPFDNKLHDGFRSFPSGHSSWAWSGLLYLSLFFCSKFAITIPYLPTTVGYHAHGDYVSSEHELLPLHENGARGMREGSKRDSHDEDSISEGRTVNLNPISLRNEAAAPPNYLIIPALIPVAVAMYVCSTRFAEFYHFGFDIIFGSLIGITTAFLAFRWYHLPISRGQGWAWGPRSKDRAWAIGVGTGGYVGTEGWRSCHTRNGDAEPGCARG